MYDPTVTTEAEASAQDKAYEIIRAYGCLAPTLDETRAYVAVLDRMGAFARSEREVLITVGILV